MTDKTCPLGPDCDLTVAYMAGVENACGAARQRIEELRLQLNMARLEADAMRTRAEVAENRCHELGMAFSEVRNLVCSANFREERYPRFMALLRVNG